MINAITLKNSMNKSPSALEPQGIQQSTKSQQTANKFLKKCL
ncbi:hypothetical protein VN93_0341 [Lactococcus cremoris]|uniref:Uncharacterized protein n=1 Tax=Lactococcus lactis subsp. cremoris TaxID=1359 RepID=A0ABR5EJD3_LACLC|nr:hypothetical protein L3107_pB0047 [Lactococcus cremoris]KKW74696.1 hypothetical protein VN93_0341 [Lactococcus cremoris]